MKKYLVSPAVLFVAVLLFQPVAPAAASGYSLYGSYLSGDDLDDTVGLGLRYSLGAREGKWAVDLTSAIYDGGEAPLQVNESVTVQDDIRVVPLDLGLRYTFRRPGIEPYLGAGGTFARLRSDFGEMDDETGFYVMGGLRFGDHSGPAFFVEGQYRNLSEASVKVFPDQPEASQPKVDLSGFAVNVGVSWGI